jgi:hypothetical protein
LRSICLELSEAHEEPAWAGIRWNTGKKNLAPALAISGGRPPAYARAASTDDGGFVIDMRTDRDEIELLPEGSHRVPAPKELAVLAE